ncbi:hypothetical protein [Polyangium jinanense]|uniref:Uncharacterized protein n=1 Tax=Polyangium jinanense TaxID=2829994 RepID=A0A9X3WZP4_9BACT|nr:hypothetical protein [Polyangium jinanense]MDC3952527.1 hypothetical protein [Polyangium jinanense]MDC3980155.1 hypothetical protein [Polyangium jinanense]
MNELKTRPAGVTVVAVLMALSGVLTVLSSVPAVTGAELPPWAIALDVAVGIAMFAVAWGLITLRAWAWVVTLGIQAVNGLFAIVSVAAAPAAWPAWIAIVIAAVVVFYLTRPNVRLAFGVGAPRI